MTVMIMIMVIIMMMIIMMTMMIIMMIMIIMVIITESVIITTTTIIIIAGKMLMVLGKKRRPYKHKHRITYQRPEQGIRQQRIAGQRLKQSVYEPKLWRPEQQSVSLSTAGSLTFCAGQIIKLHLIKFCY